jgi:hypothetical protein
MGRGSQAASDRRPDGRVHQRAKWETRKDGLRLVPIAKTARTAPAGRDTKQGSSGSDVIDGVNLSSTFAECRARRDAKHLPAVLASASGDPSSSSHASHAASHRQGVPNFLHAPSGSRGLRSWVGRDNTRPRRDSFWARTSPDGWPGPACPMFVSDRRLLGLPAPPGRGADWALDSSGFSELAEDGSWAHGPTPAQYVTRVRRYAQHIGRLAWAAPQVWMCEPFMLAKTGLTVAEHQAPAVEYACSCAISLPSCRSCQF